MEINITNYIDAHCHIDLYANSQQVISRCLELSMTVLSVTTTPNAWEKTKALAPKNSKIITALGLHPELAHKFKSSIDLFEDILPETKFVGEIGLDGSKHAKIHWSDQLYVFRRILKACAKLDGRVLLIHSRKATSAVLDELEAFPKAGVPVLHWFSGTKRELERAIKLGAWFSVGPAMLMTSKGRSLVTLMPQDRIITETDGPIVQIDNRPICPWDVDLAISDLSELWGFSRSSVGGIVSANAKVLMPCGEGN